MVCKLVILIRRKKGVSEEQFHTYWSENHAKIFLKGKKVQEKVIAYTQYHVDKRDLTSFKSLAAVPRGNYWDGIVNITVPELEDLEEIFEHADYLKDVVDDEAKFLDREDALLFIGHNEDKKLDGVVQPGVW